jgi:hypothetical protein
MQLDLEFIEHGETAPLYRGANKFSEAVIKHTLNNSSLVSEKYVRSNLDVLYLHNILNIHFKGETETFYICLLPDK